MGGKKPRGRGVLASILGMAGDQQEEQATEATSHTAVEAAAPAEPTPHYTAPDMPDGSTEPLGEAVPSAVGTQVRESYEPGWYRISLAQSQVEPADAGHGEPEYAEQVTEPTYNEEAYEPAYTEPAYTEPEYTEPAYTEPEYTEPAYTEPAYTEPQYSQYETGQPEADGSPVEASYEYVEEIPSYEPPGIPVYEESTHDEPVVPADPAVFEETIPETLVEFGLGTETEVEPFEEPRAVPVERETDPELSPEAAFSVEAATEETPEDQAVWQFEPFEEEPEKAVAAQVPAGMREAYEPSWYRISLAEGQTGQRASDDPDPGKEEPRGRRGAAASRRTPPTADAPRRRSFSRRRGKEDQPPEEERQLGRAAQDRAARRQAEVERVAPHEAQPELVPQPPAATPTPSRQPVAAAPHPEPSGPSLVSLAAKERRNALEQLAARGLGDDDVSTVSALVSDPERDIRALAVQTLAQRAELVDADVMRRALQDPTDEVRAATIRLAAARRDPDLTALAPLVGARRWPLTQQTALDVLPGLILEHGIQAHGFDALLSAVAVMESSPVGDERGGFVEIVRAVGQDRLVEALQLPDDRRLGVVRLLLEDGSPEALRAISEHGRDPLDEVRVAATSARDQLIAVEPEPAPELPPVFEAEPAPEPQPVFEVEPAPVIEPEPVAEPEPAPIPEPEPAVKAVVPPAPAPPPPAPKRRRAATPAPVEGEIISGLAHALEDPDESVRERAGRALSEVDRKSLLKWTRQALSSGEQEAASLAATVAEAASLREVAGEILGGAAGLRPESRGSLVGALSSFGIDVVDLVEMARSVEVSRRPDAVRLLWQVAGRRVLPPLRAMLEESSGPVRVAVLDVFGESGDPSAIEVAHRVLEQDSSPVVRATAIQVIGRAGLDQRTTALAQALDDPDPDVRATAVELLPQGMAGQAGDLLLKALKDEDDRVWQPAMRHLVSLPERDLPKLWTAIREAKDERRDQLLSLLERTSHERLGLVALEHLSSPDYDDRMLAISLASRSGTSEAVQAIMGSLVDPLPTVRRAAAAALAELRSPEAIPALAQTLNDPDPGVREEALKTLSAVDDERVLDPLINALKDPEARVREVASEGLIRWSSPAVARRLVEALTSPVLRGPASELLARMGTSAVDPLVNLLREGHPDIAGTVGDTLERLVGREVFLERLSSMNPAERLGAVEALGAMGGLEAVEGLIRALSDPNEDIRIRALRLLGDLGDRRAVEAVERAAQGDPVPEVAAAAEDALRRLQGA